MTVSYPKDKIIIPILNRVRPNGSFPILYVRDSVCLHKGHLDTVSQILMCIQINGGSC